MSTPISSSSSSVLAAELAVPASADEAISLAGFVGSAVSDSLITVGRSRLLAGDSLREDFLAISDLAARLKQLIDTPGIPVTAAAVKAVRGKDAETLKSLFSADGPNLGADLAESYANLQMFANVGVSMNTSLQTPVLVEIVGPGQTSSVTFAWWSESQLANLNYPIVQNNDYPGSYTRVREVKDNDGKVSHSISYIIFDDYANLRTTLAELGTAASEIGLIALEMGDQLSKDLAYVVQLVSRIDRESRSVASFISNEEKNLQKLSASGQEIEEVFERFRRLIRRDIELRLVRTDRPEKNALSESAAESGRVNSVILQNGASPGFDTASAGKAGSGKADEAASSENHVQRSDPV